jgi:RNA polymerase sigma factor (sigma-70 family)
MQPERMVPTRQSLLSRLKNWENQDSWREFFDTYWRLIYEVARKAGFNDAEAQDIVQEALLSVARQMPGFKYNRSEGSFKSWLLQITRRRIADQFRKRYRGGGMISSDSPEFMSSDNELLLHGATTPLDELWEVEWKSHIAEIALDRVKKRVKAAQFQIFDLSVLKSWPLGRVSEALGVSKTQVYLARQRVGALVKKEVKRLAEEGS